MLSFAAKLASELRSVLRYVPERHATPAFRVLKEYELSSTVDESEAKICGNCRFASSVGSYPRYLKCRFNPPAVIPTPAGRADTTWPMVERDDWCSKWLPHIFNSDCV